MLYPLSYEGRWSVDVWRDLTADVNSLADRGGAQVWSIGVGRRDGLDPRGSVGDQVEFRLGVLERDGVRR